MEYAAFWRKLLGDRPAKESKSRLLYDERVKLLARLPKSVVTGKPNASLPREELDRLLAAVRQKVTARTYVFLVRFLARGLQQGNKELGWDAAVPATPVTVPPEPSRHNPLKFEALNRLRLIEHRFLDTIKEFPGMNASQRLGMLLLSAILFGGMLHKRWLNPWFDALKDRARIHGVYLWLELEMVWQPPREKREKAGPNSRDRSAEKPIIMKRRWIADPLTRALIVQWLNLPAEMQILSDRSKDPYDYVRNYLIRIGVPLQELPKGIGELLEMAETRLGLTVSPFLASYATGKIKCVSVPAECWTRLMSGKAVSRETAVSVQDAFDETEVRFDRRAGNASDWIPLRDQQSLLRRMRRIVSGQKGVNKGNAAIRKELTSFIQTYDLQLSPLLRYLSEWAYLLLTPKGANKPSTVDRYLTAIAGFLLIVCGTDELLEFEAPEFEEIYDNVIALIKSDKEKRFAWIPLINFHRYLVSRYQAPRLQRGIYGRRSGPPETSVDANLVSQGEFDRIKSVLGWENANQSRTSTAALLLAILGFRCGLRRNEAHFLRIRDIQGRHRPELILRTTSKRRLKSRNSTRRLPLHILLQPEELQLLLKWVEKHDKGDREALVFSVRGMRHQALPEAEVFAPITKALALVTGDSSLRYHHLRHSFLTWLLIRLAGSSSTLYNAASFLKHPEFSENRVAEMRDALLGNEHLGRKGAHAVACLCGHSDLDTSFTSYIHICDWLLSRELSFTEALPVISIEGLVAATGLSRATVYRSIPACGEACTILNSDWDRLFIKHSRSLVQCIDPHIAKAREPVNEPFKFKNEAEDTFSWERVQQALKMYQAEGTSIEEISIQLDTELNEVKSWVENAERLAAMKTRQSGKNTRPKILKVLQKPKAVREQNYRIVRMKRKSELSIEFSFRHHDLLKANPTTGKIVFPVIPIARRDQEQATRFLEAFMKLGAAMKREVFHQVEYFAEFYIRTENMLVFHEVGKMRRFVNAIKAIGVEKGMIRLLEFPAEGESAKNREFFRLVWEKELELSGCHWGKGTKNYSRRRYFNNAESLKKNERRRGPAEKKVSQANFRTIGIQVTGRVSNSEFRGGYSKNCFLYAIYMIDIARASLIDHGIDDLNSTI